jgi:hypothetical protein
MKGPKKEELCKSCETKKLMAALGELDRAEREKTCAYCGKPRHAQKASGPSLHI